MFGLVSRARARSEVEFARLVERHLAAECSAAAEHQVVVAQAALANEREAHHRLLDDHQHALAEIERLRKKNADLIALQVPAELDRMDAEAKQREASERVTKRASARRTDGE